MMTKCPCCESEVEPEKAGVEMGEDGLPIALSLIEGLGVPVVAQAYQYQPYLNGEKTDRCVGFDRARGLLWRYRADAAGNLLRRNDEFLIERVSGEVTLELAKH